MFTVLLAALNGGDYFSASLGEDVSNAVTPCLAKSLRLFGSVQL
jgi:hypothetical protein